MVLGIAKKEKKESNENFLSKYDALTQLRLSLGLIFILMTLAFVLAPFNSIPFSISAILLILGYIIVILLLVKLFITRRL